MENISKLATENNIDSYSRLVNYEYFLEKNNPSNQNSFVTCKDIIRSESIQSISQYNENDQYRMLGNSIKLLLIFNFLPLMGLIFSITYYKWYKLIINDDKYWVSLLFIYDEELNEFSSIQEFLSFKCRSYLSKNSQVFCDQFRIFKVCGGISFFFIIFGIFMHFFHIIQLILILLNKYQYLQLPFCIKAKTLQVSVFILYLGAVLIWVIFIILSQEEFDKFGISFYFALGSIIMYIAVFIYFVSLKKELKEKKMIGILLYPEKIITNTENEYHKNFTRDSK